MKKGTNENETNEQGDKGEADGRQYEDLRVSQ
jgi:hypothetical protein